jgi:hypothetical protein
MQDRVQRTDIDEFLEARVITGRRPFLVATVTLPGNVSENAINVEVFGLDHPDVPVGEQTPTGAFLQVQHTLTTEPIHPDQFALSVIEVGGNWLRFRIKRLDTSGGWGQPLKVQILFFAG